MAVVTAPLLVVRSEHAFVGPPGQYGDGVYGEGLYGESAEGSFIVSGQRVGISLVSVHDLDVTPSTSSGGPVVVAYNGFLTVRSSNRAIQLAGELGKGSFVGLARQTRVGVFAVIGKVRPVVLTQVRGGLAGAFSLLFYDNINNVAAARNLFASGSLIEIRICPEPLLVGVWIAILEVTESRLAYADWARKFDVSFVQAVQP